MMSDVSASLIVLPLKLYVMVLARSCSPSSVYGALMLSAVFETLPLSETIISTTVLSSTGSRFIYLSTSSSCLGVSTNDVRFVISDSIRAARLIVLSNSYIFCLSCPAITFLVLSVSSCLFISSFTYSLYAFSDGTRPDEV